jgi:ribonuclease BN (tRNA processing enzyme)
MSLYACKVFLRILSVTNRARKSVEAQAGRVLALRSSPDYLLIPNNPWMGVDIIEGRNQQIESSFSQIISVANVSHLSTEMGDHIQGGTETVMSNTIESRGDEEGVKVSMMTAFNAVDSTVTSDAYSVSVKSNATSVLLDTNEDVVLGITVQNEGKGVETKEEAKEGEKEMIEDVIKEEEKREKEGEKEEEIKEVIVEEKEKKDEEKEEEIEKKEEIEVQKDLEEEGEEEEEKEGEPTVGTKVARASSISHDKVVTTKPSAVDLKIQKQIETLPAPPSSSVSAISKDTPDLSAPSSSPSAIPEENLDLSGTVR